MVFKLETGSNYIIPMVWWNIGLSPPVSSKRNKASDDQIHNIAVVIKELIDLEYEIICLGEVSTGDVIKLAEVLDLANIGYSYVEGADKKERLYFDTAIIYHKNLEIVQQENGSNCHHFIMSIEDRFLKIYEKYNFYHSKIDQELTFILSHWPSQLRDNTIQTTEISIELRKQIHLFMDTESNIILMGDYNLEPYSVEIVKHLHTSRDRNIVSRKKKLLYNPCWNLLPVSNQKEINGTYSYKSPNQEWLILDQIMFSKCFLKEPWYLDEKNIEILNISDLIPEQEFKNPSDHWPLSTLLFWNPEHV